MKTIKITLSRQYVELIQKCLFPYLRLLKQSSLNNVAHCTVQSPEYLRTLIINSLTDEIILMINQKMINTTSDKIKLKFSDAVAVAFYSIMINWAIDKDQHYMNHLRNTVVMIMDKELTRNKIYQQGIMQKQSEYTESDY